jgi:hypothetical protein
LKASDVSEMFNLIVYVSLCCLTVYWMFSARAFSYTTLSYPHNKFLWIKISFNIILICPKPLKLCEKRTRRVIPEPSIRLSPEPARSLHIFTVCFDTLLPPHLHSSGSHLTTDFPSKARYAFLASYESLIRLDLFNKFHEIRFNRIFKYSLTTCS